MLHDFNTLYQDVMMSPGETHIPFASVDEGGGLFTRGINTMLTLTAFGSPTNSILLRMHKAAFLLSEERCSIVTPWNEKITMSSQLFSPKQAYKFLKVDEYFDQYKDWDKVIKVEVIHSTQPQERGTQPLADVIDKPCSMLLQFPMKDTVRFRFNPVKCADDYPRETSRAVVLDSYEDLITHLDTLEQFQVAVKNISNGIEDPHHNRQLILPK